MTREEILAGESKIVEFKVERPEKSIKYMKSVVAFANGKGGRIVFGIDDETREICREIVRCGPERVNIALDYFDASIKDRKSTRLNSSH